MRLKNRLKRLDWENEIKKIRLEQTGKLRLEAVEKIKN
jgi:hypothetical protein